MELQPTVKLKPVTDFENSQETSAMYDIKKMIEQKNKVLDVIYQATINADNPQDYATLISFHDKLLKEVTEDELAFEILRLVKRHGGIKKDAVIELRMINEGK